jgi:hypothetical protein
MIPADTFEIKRVVYTTRPRWFVSQWREGFKMMVYGPFRTKTQATSIKKELERIHTAIAYFTISFPKR